VFIETRDNGFVPRIADLRRAVSPRTRAIIVNTPNNPTGAVYDRALLKDIAALAIDADLWLVFDECYGGFAHAPHRHESIVSITPEARPRTLIVNAFSKQLALTGWRLGYLAGPAAAIAAVKGLQSHTTSNPNVIAQHAVLAYLDGADRSFEANLRATLGAARQRGLEILSRLKGIPQPSAQGGFYFYLDLTSLLKLGSDGNGLADADAVSRMLLESAAVASVSGAAFGDPMGLRLSYGIPLDELDAGLSRLTEALNSLL
ncbi:MAG: aminotransferase class I/II-fold pyridoxal phosphate-dependent enzyme, partial [Alphaproteobacteria bacterium]|nr:aminotransferase class I/II-fold pyridoxal phosphate-dependent enzyme [Alphaproteobacteria bacterium]